MPDGLYDRDFLAWSERQASLLRRLAAGERLNEAVDWPNLIDEVESLGRSETRACESLLRQALAHLLKIRAWPAHAAVPHWRGEALGFLYDAQAALSPSMRQHLAADVIYVRAKDQALAGANEMGMPMPLPELCPLTLEELLAPRPDIAALLARLAG